MPIKPKTSIENPIVSFENNKNVLDSVKGDSNGERNHYKDSSVKIAPEKVDVKCGELEFGNEHQRHLSNAIVNSANKLTTVKGRVEEIERRTFTGLHRGTPNKVNRSKVKAKSPILRHKQPTNHRKANLSSSQILGSAKKINKNLDILRLFRLRL